MDEQRQDPLVKLVEQRLAAGDVSATAIVDEILARLAEDVPEHFGPDAQAAYRRWLRRRAQLLTEDVPYVPAVLAESWRWE